MDEGAAGKPRRNILIVDDNFDHRDLFKQLLDRDPRHTYTYHEASNAEDALAYCNSVKLDCIILDYILPGTNGVDFLHDLATEFGRVFWPVVFITGFGDEEVATLALKAGARDYIVKGQIKTNTLLRAVNRVIEQRTEENALRQKTFEQEKEIRRLRKEVKSLREKLKGTTDDLLEANRQLIGHIRKTGAS